MIMASLVGGSILMVHLLSLFLKYPFKKSRGEKELYHNASVLSGGEVKLETFIFQLISPSEPRFQGLLGVDKCCFGHDLVCSLFLLIRLLAI